MGKSRFDIDIDLGADTVTCPGWVTTPIRRHSDGSGIAAFASACAGCPLRTRCTTSERGRTVSVSSHEDVLTRARTRQKNPDWQTDYRATRPKVERKLGHLMHRRHGGRNARVRGRVKVDADFRLLAAATNLARLAVLGLHLTPTNGWLATA
ncbi:MAG: transposase [Pseudonocardiaceae bacterium]